MTKEIFIRVVSTVIALLIVAIVVAWYEQMQKHKSCGCAGAKPPAQPGVPNNTTLEESFPINLSEMPSN